MTLAVGAASAPFVIGQKGRVMLPAAVRRAAHLTDGMEVVARPDGEGRILIESIDAIRARLRDAAPAPTDLDTAADVRLMRQQDQMVSEANFTRQSRSLPSERESEQTGRALLDFLGL